MPELPAEPPYKVVCRGFSSIYDLALGVDSNEPKTTFNLT